MVTKIDWKALDAVYAGSEQKPSPAPKGDGVTRHSLKVQIEMAEERAGIREYDWGWSRIDAEAFAFRNIKKN